jgi:hypothetical protein
MTTQLQGTILGVNRRYIANPGNISSMELLVVLVAGAIGDYAAYCGIGTPEWVRDHGNKISFEEACCHFPGGQLEREKYRD